MRDRFNKWKHKHPDVVVLVAQVGVIVGMVGMGVALSRTFKADAQAQVDRLKAKNEALNEELAGIWRWMDAQILAGAEFKPVDAKFGIDGQNYTC